MSKGKITLTEIAKEAAVSRTAVSFYLNGKAKQYNLSDETCERIRKTIESNHYVPNVLARAIAGKKTLLIGVILDGIDSSFYANILQGIEEYIAPLNYHILLGTSKYNYDSKQEMFSFMDQKGVDGFIFSPIGGGQNSGRDVIKEIAKRKPTVSITLPQHGFTSIYNDNIAGGRLAADELYRNGHRKIAYIGSSSDGFKRADSFIARLQELGLKATVYPKADNFIKDAAKYSAVFCFSDYKVMELYMKAAAASIKIPDDLSVIGYDNMDFLNLLSPRPVSIHQYKTELGKEAARILMEKINGSKTESDFVFAPLISEGASIKNIA